MPVGRPHRSPLDILPPPLTILRSEETSKAPSPNALSSETNIQILGRFFGFDLQRALERYDLENGQAEAFFKCLLYFFKVSQSDIGKENLPDPVNFCSALFRALENAHSQEEKEPGTRQRFFDICTCLVSREWPGSFRFSSPAILSFMDTFTKAGADTALAVLQTSLLKLALDELKEETHNRVILNSSHTGQIKKILWWIADSEAFTPYFGGRAAKESFIFEFKNLGRCFIRRGKLLNGDSRKKLLDKIFAYLMKDPSQINLEDIPFSLFKFLLLPRGATFLDTALESDDNPPPYELLEKMIQITLEDHNGEYWPEGDSVECLRRETFQRKIATIFAEIILGLDEKIDQEACRLLAQALERNPNLRKQFDSNSIFQLKRLYISLTAKKPCGNFTLQNTFDSATVPEDRPEIQEAIQDLLGIPLEEPVTKRDILLLCLQSFGHRQPRIGICALSESIIYTTLQKPTRLLELAVGFFSTGKVQFYHQGEKYSSPSPIPLAEFLGDDVISLYPVAYPEEFLQCPAILQTCCSLGIFSKSDLHQEINIFFDSKAREKLDIRTFAKRLVWSSSNIKKCDRDVTLYRLLKRLDGIGGRRFQYTMAYLVGQSAQTLHPKQGIGLTKKQFRDKHRIIDFVAQQLEKSLAQRRPSKLNPKIKKAFLQLAYEVFYLKQHRVSLRLKDTHGDKRTCLYNSEKWLPCNPKSLRESTRQAFNEEILQSCIDKSQVACLWNGSTFVEFKPSLFLELIRKKIHELTDFSPSEKATLKNLISPSDFNTAFWKNAFKEAKEGFISDWCGKEGSSQQAFFKDYLKGLWLPKSGDSVFCILRTIFGQKLETRDTSSESLAHAVRDSLSTLLPYLTANQKVEFDHREYNMVPGRMRGHAISFLCGTPFLDHVATERQNGCAAAEGYDPLKTQVFDPIELALGRNATIPRVVLGFMKSRLKDKIKKVQKKNSNFSVNLEKLLKSFPDKKNQKLGDLIELLLPTLQDLGDAEDRMTSDLEGILFDGIRMQSPYRLFNQKRNDLPVYQKILKSLEVPKDYWKATGECLLSLLSQSADQNLTRRDFSSFLGLEMIATCLRDAISSSSSLFVPLDRVFWAIESSLGLPRRIPYIDLSWRKDLSDDNEVSVIGYFQGAFFKKGQLLLSHFHDGEMLIWSNRKVEEVLPLTIAFPASGKLIPHKDFFSPHRPASFKA